MKVGMVVQWGKSGGGPRFALELSKALSRHYPGHFVVSFSSLAELAPRFRELHVPRHELRTYRSRIGVLAGIPRLVIELMALVSFMRRHRVAFVLVAMESPWQALLAVVVRATGREYVVCVHDAEMHPGDFTHVEHLLRTVERRMATRFVVFSTHVRRVLEKRGPGASRPILESVHGAYGAGEFVSMPRSLPGRLVRLGFFGRLSHYKGIDTAISATQILLDRGRSVELVVKGSGDFEVGQVPANGVKIIRGWVPEAMVSSELMEFDVLLLPYREASQSGVIGWAWSLGIPVVATPVGGLVEQVSGTRSGILAASADATSLAEAIETLLSNPKLYNELSRHALRAAEERSWDRVARDLQPLLEQV